MRPVADGRAGPHTPARSGQLAEPPAAAALLAAAATGDTRAFAALYDAMAAAVYGLARRVVVDPSIAEEVTQETFAAVWATAGTFDSSRGSARGWVLTIAHRRAVDVVRHEQAARNRIERVAAATRERPAADIADDVVENASRSSDAQAVHRALQTLTELQRAAVQLAYFKGCTYREVAEILEVPLGTAKTRIRDGLHRLAQELGPRDLRIEGPRRRARSLTAMPHTGVARKPTG